MTKIIFDYQDYKAYLNSFILSKVGKGRGLRAQMADQMGCQRGFVTKVLLPDSAAHLSLEQAEKLNSFLNHSNEEGNYFLLLVQFARAGTVGLRAHFRNQMKQVLNRRLEVKKESQSRSHLSAEDHMRYYSFWYYAAIRVAVSIPSLQTKEALSARLKLPMATTIAVLEFLTSCGLIEQKGDRFFHLAKQQVLLTPDHPTIARHHANWRTQALKALESTSAHNLHYSYIVTLSENEALQIRSYLVEAIKEVLARAAPSKEETLYSFCVDYFEL